MYWIMFFILFTFFGILYGLLADRIHEYLKSIPFLYDKYNDNRVEGMIVLGLILFILCFLWKIALSVIVICFIVWYVRNTEKFKKIIKILFE